MTGTLNRRRKAVRPENACTMDSKASQTVYAVSSMSALESMAGKVDELPLLPQSLVSLMRLSPDEDDYFDRFEDLAREDPALAVKIVSYANSAASSPASPILSIQAALARMGIQPVRALVASLAVQRAFMPVEPSQINLWKHSVTVGVASQRIAMLLDKLEVDPGFAYLAGLLHDVGRFVMFEHASDELLRVDETDWNTGDDLLAADMDVFMFTHSELGYLACQRWGLPDDISNVVRFHHGDLEQPIAPGSIDATNLCVQVADRLDLNIFSKEKLRDATCDDYVAILSEQCSACETIAAYIDPNVLSMHIPTIRAEADELLAGLGFS
ncbi:MAG: HDOD domain-containing protein [Woeseiaceae bacterium]|nr:HDOD domain-containing protein [Woeseiaceae bacterium]